MRDWMNIGPTPSGESCAQLGSENYGTIAQMECRIFINQLLRVFGTPPKNAFFKITHNPHDFGTYLEVAIDFDTEDQEESDFAYKVEAHTPEYWDDEAKQELEWINIFLGKS